MSRKFKITIADAEWVGSDDGQSLFAPSGVKLGYAIKDRNGWAGSTLIGNFKGGYKSMSSAKRYVIRQLAKPEKMK